MTIGSSKKNFLRLFGMYINSTLIAIFLLLCTGNTHAQDKYINDYVALYTEDTIYGNVEYINESKRQFHNKIRIKDHNGKQKRYSRKEVVAFRKDNEYYVSFWLKQPSLSFNFKSFVNPFYNIDMKKGEQHFLKLIQFGNLSRYELEWFEQAETRLHVMTLFKKADDIFLIRADQGIFRLKTKVLLDYFKDCITLQEKIRDKVFKKVEEIVEFYNDNCSAY